MTEVEMNDGTTRDELVERVSLMEAMIAEGRQTTGRHGWYFVLWGLVDIVGVIWQSAMPHWIGVWPITIGAGILLQAMGMRLFDRDRTPTLRHRALGSVWRVMGVTLCLYCFSAMFAHRTNEIAYLAAIFMILGMAHSISAMILRWGVQGGVGALWLAGGVTCYFVPDSWLMQLFVFEMIVGMVLFGLYVMLLERRRAASAPVARHG